jgi:hypothetical protein
VQTEPKHPKNFWGSTCSNETCYGVPLYRQFLSGKDGGSEAASTGEWKQWYKNGCGTKDAPTLNSPQCRWPFIRMAGMNKAVRETLTINNGTYYLDTAVPYDVQKAEKFSPSSKEFFNAFKGGETYNVFFVYAKKSTKQTYQIYMGTDATADDIKPIQVKIPGAIDPGDFSAPDGFLTKDVKTTKVTGIINVTIDFSTVASLLAPTAANGLCVPVSFCTADGATGCKASDALKNSPLAKIDAALPTEAQRVCSTWAIKDLDCPKGGCLGFSFKIRDTGFEANATVDKPTPRRPFPEIFPMDDKDQGIPNWLVEFLPTHTAPDNGIGGQCHYQKIPGTPNCKVPQ